MLCLVGASLLTYGTVHAQQQVNKLVVSFAPGAATDTIGRLVAEGLGQRMGRVVIVEKPCGCRFDDRH